MGLDKFMNNDVVDDASEIRIIDKGYKNKVDEALQEKLNKDTNNFAMNLLDLEEEEKVEKKIGMTIYFKEEDLELLKSVAYFKNSTVNKTIMNILEIPLKTTRENLDSDFNIKTMANKYDKKSRNKHKNK